MQARNKTALLFGEIRELILTARKTVARNINAIQVVANFEIGHRIVMYEQQGKKRAEYGKTLLKKLSVKLTKEFGKGFSQSNLEYMRRFYLLYHNRLSFNNQLIPVRTFKKHASKISQTVSGKSNLKSQKALFTLSWSHYVFLVGIKDENMRSFYEIEAANNNWSLAELTRQFNSGLYERLALSRDKRGIQKLSKKGQIIERPEDMLKEPYVLEFLGIDEKAQYSESDLESAIIDG